MRLLRASLIVSVALASTFLAASFRPAMAAG